MAQRLSQLATEIWPFLLPKVSNMVSGATSGSSSGAATVGLHDLSGALHRGTLADAQAPQFLLSNGSRPLTGDLAVDAGILLDGVDLSAHATDINAHHNKAHGITDSANHTVTGSQYQVVGLTAANTLGLLTPSATPGANALIKTDGSSAVTLTGLLYADGGIDFGTNVLDEGATYLEFTGSKAIKFNQNIGNANWTVYNTGGADFGGSVNITGSGDLYVAGSLGGAGGVLKTSGNRVGIACVPDSQFALDVAGPCRAQWFIGPHAIQLDNARMICHYDGAAPYNTNYGGILLGHKGQAATSSGGIVFRPGKFGKAVQIAEATTNLITNPSFEVDLTGWSTTAGTTVTRSTVKAYYGSASALFSAAAGTTVFARTISVTIGATYTISAWVHLTSAAGSLNMDLSDKAYEFNAAVSTKNQWVRIVGTFTATATENAALRFYSTDGAVGYIDGVQMEAKAYCTPYCDGSLNSEHSWAGTAHASTSSRNAAALYYDVGNLDAQEGTLFMWVRIDGFYNNNRLLNGAFSDTDFLIYTNSSGAGYFTYNSVTVDLGPLTARTWAHICVTWSRSSGKITSYLNGIQVDQDNISATATLHATQISIGSKWASQHANGLIDDVAILSTAIDANQVRAIYESNAPVFAESSTVSWVATPSGLVWADERGLWMRDTAGNSVLGVYGGEAATYSWAGFTMESGDLVLGRNAVGSSAILWDQSGGTFGFYGAGSGTAQAQIGTDGVLYTGTAGAARVQMSATELAGYNVSNVKQWYGSTTDGKFYSASGKTWLDRNGLNILAPAAADLGVENYIGWATQGNTSVLSGYITCGFTNTSGNPSGEMSIITNAGGGSSRLTLAASILRLNAMTTSAAAVGSYAGKLKINISGTDVYIPYYAS